MRLENCSLLFFIGILYANAAATAVIEEQPLGIIATEQTQPPLQNEDADERETTTLPPMEDGKAAVAAENPIVEQVIDVFVEPQGHENAGERKRRQFGFGYPGFGFGYPGFGGYRPRPFYGGGGFGGGFGGGYGGGFGGFGGRGFQRTRIVTRTRVVDRYHGGSFFG